MTKKLRDLDDVLKNMTLDEARYIVKISNDYPCKKKALSICGIQLSMRVKDLVPNHVDVLVNKARKLVDQKTFRNYDDLLKNMTIAEAHEILTTKNELDSHSRFKRAELYGILNLDKNTKPSSVLLLMEKANEVIKRHSLNPRETGVEMINNQKAEAFEQSLKAAFDATSIESVLEERGKTHGNFADVAYISQTIKKQMQGAPRYDKTTLDMRESLDMIAGKMARIVCGNSKEIDHWRDIEGYAALVRKQLEVKNG